jgi:hypothetical protein
VRVCQHIFDVCIYLLVHSLLTLKDDPEAPIIARFANC